MRPDGRRSTALRAAGIVGALVASFALACGGGGSQYDVTIHFNGSVTQEGMDLATSVLRGFDANVNVVATESFPPVGHAVVKTDAPRFCDQLQTAIAGLESIVGIQDVSCEPLKKG